MGQDGSRAGPLTRTRRFSPEAGSPIRLSDDGQAAPMTALPLPDLLLLLLALTAAGLVGGLVA
ncbi:MAG: hypothetical protein ACK5RN_10610, partial [bacterium]